MPTLQDRFNQAVADSRMLSEKPDNATLLRIYALYKQGTEGDTSGERPAMADFVARAKFDAWAEQRGQSPEDAMHAYVELIEDLK